MAGLGDMAAAIRLEDTEEVPEDLGGVLVVFEVLVAGMGGIVEMDEE